MRTLAAMGGLRASHSSSVLGAVAVIVEVMQLAKFAFTQSAPEPIAEASEEVSTWTSFGLPSISFTTVQIVVCALICVVVALISVVEKVEATTLSSASGGACDS